MKSVLVIALVFGILAVLLGCSRWLARRPWAAAGNLLIAVLLFGLVHSLWPAVVHLATYQPMPQESRIAQLYSERTGPHAYRVTLTRLPDGQMQLFEIQGDEWRLDIRTLAWRGHAASIGLTPSYRLDRLDARLLDSASAVASGYSLSGDAAGADIWHQARLGTRWGRYTDARHASGPWRPLTHTGRFDVWLRYPGNGDAVLEARPANDAAAQALQDRARPGPTTAAR